MNDPDERQGLSILQWRGIRDCITKSIGNTPTYGDSQSLTIIVNYHNFFDFDKNKDNSERALYVMNIKKKIIPLQLRLQTIGLCFNCKTNYTKSKKILFNTNALDNIEWNEWCNYDHHISITPEPYMSMALRTRGSIRNNNNHGM
jgi:hypothetical protein